MLSYLSYYDKRFITNFSKCFKNYYETLGISPKATQADIKAAYYKLSMLYHPDKNKGSEDASEKFRMISAAYEILSNYKSRKMYDKGILYDGSKIFSRKTEPSSKGITVPSGRTPVYDFDEWSKAHYGQTFARRTAARADYQNQHMVHKKIDKESRISSIIYSIAIIVATLLCSGITYFDNEDTVSPVTNNKLKTKSKE